LGSLRLVTNSDGDLLGALGTGADITQGAGNFIRAGSLSGVADGTVRLASNTNEIQNLNGFASQGFTLGTSSGLNVNQAVSGGAGGISLTAFNGPGVTINPLGTLTSAGLINVNSNAALRVGAAVTGGAGGVTLRSATGLDIDNAVTASGGVLSVSNTGGGGLRLNGPSGSLVNTGGAVTASSGALLNIQGEVSGAGVTFTSAGDTAVNAAVNAGAGVLSATTTGSGEFLTTAVGTLSGRAVNIDAAGRVSLIGAVTTGTSGGALKAGGSLTVDGTITSAGGVLQLQTTGGGVLTMNQAVSAVGTLDLRGSGAVTQAPAGVITAGTLTGANGSTVTLENPLNAITNLGAFSAQGLKLVDVGGLNITGAVNGGAGTSGLADIRTSGDLTVAAAGGSVSATKVALTTTGAGSDIDLRGAVSNEELVELTSSGNISQTSTGVISATTLRVSATSGSVDLDNADNTVANLGTSTAANGFTLRDSTGGLNVTGAVSGGAGATSITTSGGVLSLAGNNVSGLGVTLVGAGVTQDAASAVNAGAAPSSSTATMVRSAWRAAWRRAQRVRRSASWTPARSRSAMSLRRPVR
jgi:hypothetical protein